MNDPKTKERFDLRAADGTTLACYRSGTGPPLVMVPGALCDHTCWDPMSPHLRDAFTLYVFDRRGRGASSNTLPHSIEREVEDLELVLEAAGPRPHLFGHSAGAILALHAALRGAHLSSLLLYEPPVWQALRRDREDLDLAALNEMAEDGEYEETVKTFLRRANHTTEEQLARLQGEPRWASFVAMAPTVLYDTGIARAFNIEAEHDNLGRLGLPTLLLMGGTSQLRMHDATEAVHDAISGSRLVSLEGHGHGGIFSGPALVAGEVRSFLADAGLA
jgi:pimeloyl-ACP methyl ester carboxylesterase